MADSVRNAVVELKKCEKTLQKVSVDDPNLKLEIQKAKKLLLLLKDNPSLTWACVKVKIISLSKDRSLKTATKQKILKVIVENLDHLEDPKVELSKGRFDQIQHLWQTLCAAKLHYQLADVPSTIHECSFVTFLTKCFSFLSNQEFSAFVQKMIWDCVPGICVLVQSNRNASIAHDILSFLFKQLVFPQCDVSLKVVKIAFKSCGWKINHTVQEMLNSMLVTGHCYELDFLTPEKNVYDLIYELLLVSLDLVLGLINNVQLCLMPGRYDRLVGLKFLCKLFAEKQIPQIPNPVNFFSNLWSELLSHCKNISLYEPKELLVIAEYTPQILSHKAAHQDWCSLLFHVMKFEIGAEREKAYVAAIIKAVTNDLSVFEDESSFSLLALIRSLLTPDCALQLHGESRMLLWDELAALYAYVSQDSNNNVVALQLISIFCGTLNCLAPPPEKWSTLRRLFVKILVPYTEADPKIRMGHLIYLWTISEQEWITLHELFYKTRRARWCILQLLQFKVTQSVSPKEMKEKVMLDCIQLKSVVGSNVWHMKFIRNIFSADDPMSCQLRLLFAKLLKVDATCEQNLLTSREIWAILRDADVQDTEKEVIDTLLLFMNELICDKESMQFLLDSIDKFNSDIVPQPHMNKSNVRTNFHLLYELLSMLPHLAFDLPVLKHLLNWSRSRNEMKSMHALRCTTSFAYYCRLENYNPTLTTDKFVPMWLNEIEFGSRRKVKMAIRCIAGHLSSSRHLALERVLKIISLQLKDTSETEIFERGVSALGHFSLVCPQSLKGAVADLCMSALLHNVLKMPHPADLPSSDLDNEWTDWEELPNHISIKVKALRSIGRCMRYCGRWENASEALVNLEAILSEPKDGMYEVLRDVDYDRLRYEAACAILNIFEAQEFGGKVSKDSLLLLSHLMTDPREEVRLSFATKLHQGLSPVKCREAELGRRRGSLPSAFLGLLALLGAPVWSKHREEAEKLARRVWMSRRQAISDKALSLKGGTVAKFYELNPLSVVDNVLAAAVPILAEHSLCDVSDSSIEESISHQYLVNVAECLQFVSSNMCGDVTKDYVLNLVSVAEKTNKPATDAQNEKYAAVLGTLKIVANHYKPQLKKSSLLTPSKIILPRPFYTSEETSSFMAELQFSAWKSIERSVYRSRGKKHSSDHDREESEMAEDSEDDSISLSDHSKCSLLGTPAARSTPGRPPKRLRTY